MNERRGRRGRRDGRVERERVSIVTTTTTAYTSPLFSHSRDTPHPNILQVVPGSNSK